jgi:type I restriction enzyme S subunit
MEVKSGYKQTDVGVIPEKWEARPLSAIASKITDGDHVTPQQVRLGYYLLSARNVRNGRIDLADVDYVGFDEYRRMKLRCNPEPGDILISCSGNGFGRVAVVPENLECVLVRSAAPVKLDGRLVNSRFIQFWLQGANAQAQISNSVSRAAQPNLFINSIEKLRCPLPPTVSEQRAIAEALSDVDALLGSLDKLIAKKRDLKQAAMQQLLTGQTRLPGFDGEWDVKTVGEVAAISKGIQLHSSETNPEGNYPHFNGGISPSSYTYKSNTAGNTIAISEGGNSCGYVQFIPKPFWCGGHCYSLVQKSIENQFLYHALKGRQTAIMGLRVGSGLPNVQKTALALFKLNMPVERAEQIAIAEVLSDMEAGLAVLEQRRAKTHALKQGMMQELLTGKTRLL